MEITEKSDTEASENKKQHRSPRQYRYKLAVDGLKFKPFSLADPAPTGHQFLEGAGLETQQRAWRWPAEDGNIRLRKLRRNGRLRAYI